MRQIKLARDSAVNARTKAINQLRAILIGADPALRESLAGLGPGTLIRACARLEDPGEGASETQRAVNYTLRLLASRILELKADHVPTGTEHLYVGHYGSEAYRHGAGTGWSGGIVWASVGALPVP